MILPLQYRAPLVPVVVARASLGIDEDEVLALLDQGRLPWAWNIAVHPANPIREIRIWSKSLQSLQAEEDQFNGPDDVVIQDIVGVRHRPRLSASEIRSRLLCSQQHIARLVEFGVLRGESDRERRWIDRTSFESFLRGRRIV